MNINETSNQISRILIIDDDLTLNRFLNESLKQSGYIAESATSGTEALKLATTKHYDLILLDVVLPDTDGYEICKKLKELHILNETPIIFLTSRHDNQSIIKGFELGAVDFVTKPFTFKELHARVKTHLELKYSREQLKNQIEKLEQTQLALTKSEEKFRNSFENAFTGMALIGLDDTFISVNKRLCEILDYTEDELMRLNFNVISFPEDKNISEKYKMEMLENKRTSLQFEKRYYSKNNRIVWTSVYSALIRLHDGKPSFFVVQIYDITDQRNAQQALKESEQKYRTLAELLPQTVFEFDFTGKFTFVNKIGLENFGYSNEDFIRGLSVIEMVAESERLKFIERFQLQIQKQITLPSTEYLFRRRDGSVFPGIVHTNYIFKGEKFQSTTGIVFDITERLKAEQALKESEKKLTELNVTKDKFFSIIAHDLRNPFSQILSIAELLVNNLDNFEKDKVKKFLEVIHRTTKATYNLLENLLEWSRLQCGKIPFNPHRMYLNEIVTNCIELVQNVANSKRIEISSQLLQPVYAFADVNMIYTILRNLISNAVKFTGYAGKITISAYLQDSEIEIIVADTGIGIKAEVLNRLFRIDENITTKGTAGETGTGLGLIICKELIEKNSGTIRVESTVGEGTTFIITIPANAPLNTENEQPS